MARDGRLPFSEQLAHVSPQWGTPALPNVVVGDSPFVGGCAVLGILSYMRVKPRDSSVVLSGSGVLSEADERDEIDAAIELGMDPA